MADAAREAGAEIRTSAPASRRCSSRWPRHRRHARGRHGDARPRRHLQCGSASARCSTSWIRSSSIRASSDGSATIAARDVGEGQRRAERAADVPRRRQSRRTCTAAFTIGPGIDYLERAFDASKYGEISREPYLDVTIPVAARSVARAAGRPRHVDLRAVRALQARAGHATGREASSELAGANVMRTLEQYAPGIERAWSSTAGASRRTTSRSTYGLTGGHILHGEPALDQLFTMRPMLGWAQYRTPIAGLLPVRRRHASGWRRDRRVWPERRA